MRALTLVTLSTTLAILALGGALYIGRQEAEIARLRALERDRETWITERERLDGEIDALAEESRGFASRLAEAKESIRGRPATRRARPDSEAPNGTYDLILVLSDLRREIELLRQRFDSGTIGASRALIGESDAALPRLPHTEAPRVEDRAPPVASNVALAASDSGPADAPSGNPSGESSSERALAAGLASLDTAVGNIATRVDALRQALDTLAAQIDSEAKGRAEAIQSAKGDTSELAEKVESLRLGMESEKVAVRQDIARDTLALRDELSSIAGRVEASMSDAIGPLRGELAELLTKLEAGDRRVAELSREVERLAETMLAAARPEGDAVALAEPPAADSGTIEEANGAGGGAEAAGAGAEDARAGAPTTGVAPDGGGPLETSNDEAGVASSEEFFEPLPVRIELVELESQLVALDGGALAGLRGGEQLVVTRERRKIAVVEVIHVEDDLAAARVIRHEAGETIREGDGVERRIERPRATEASATSANTTAESTVPPPPP